MKNTGKIMLASFLLLVLIDACVGTLFPKWEEGTIISKEVMVKRTKKGARMRVYKIKYRCANAGIHKAKASKKVFNQLCTSTPVRVRVIKGFTGVVYARRVKTGDNW